MEIIRLRTTQAHVHNVADMLLDTAERATGEDGLLQVRMYKSASYQTDMALCLTWDTSPPRQQGSRTGLSISEALKTFGLVEHSIWVEKETQ
ncbi:MAG: hypothetical protein ABSC19_19580 [Syntrophorhabdales bacterium]|jgi:hypothetical protein